MVLGPYTRYSMHLCWFCLQVHCVGTGQCETYARSSVEKMIRSIFELCLCSDHRKSQSGRDKISVRSPVLSTGTGYALTRQQQPHNLQRTAGQPCPPATRGLASGPPKRRRLSRTEPSCVSRKLNCVLMEALSVSNDTAGPVLAELG